MPMIFPVPHERPAQGVPSHSRPRTGGAEHVLVDLARVASGAGIDMTVVSMMPTTGLRYPETLHNLGVDVRSTGVAGMVGPPGPGRLRRLIADASAPTSFIRISSTPTSSPVAWRRR